METEHFLYIVDYEESHCSNQRAVLSARRKEDIPFLLETHLRHNPVIKTFFRSREDIGFKVNDITKTKYTTKQELVLFPYYDKLGPESCRSVDIPPNCGTCGHLSYRNGINYKCLNCGQQE